MAGVATTNGHAWIMASLGHLAAGLLVGRLHGGADGPPPARASPRTFLAFAALAELPDIDVFGVAIGFPDASLAGHRGASHSFFVAALVGLATAALARRFGWPVVRSAVAATLAVATHGVLDACGDGGRAIPLLWPLTDERFVSPWRCLPDAPRGLRMLSRPGLFDLAVEFVVFLPLTVFSLWGVRGPRPRRRTPATGMRVRAAPSLAAGALIRR
jgi:inner membrane protein